MALASAIAALGVSAVGVSSASAATVTLRSRIPEDRAAGCLRDHRRKRCPVILTSTTSRTQAAPTRSRGRLRFPAVLGNAAPVCPLTVDVTPLATFNGNLSPTGQLTSSEPNFRADIERSVIRSTASRARSRRSRWRSARTPTRVFIGGRVRCGVELRRSNGAISDDWAALPAGTGPGCGLINSGPNRACGGLWLSNGVRHTPSSVPPLRIPRRRRRRRRHRRRRRRSARRRRRRRQEGASAAAKCKKKKKKKKK